MNIRVLCNQGLMLGQLNQAANLRGSLQTWACSSAG